MREKNLSVRQWLRTGMGWMCRQLCMQEVGGTSGMVTGDSEMFRQDNLESLVNFLPAGTAKNSDRYIETLRRMYVHLCRLCKKRWSYTTTPGHTAEAITRFGRTVFLTSQHEMFIALFL